MCYREEKTVSFLRSKRDLIFIIDILKMLHFYFDRPHSIRLCFSFKFGYALGWPPIGKIVLTLKIYSIAPHRRRQY